MSYDESTIEDPNERAREEKALHARIEGRLRGNRFLPGGVPRRNRHPFPETESTLDARVDKGRKLLLLQLTRKQTMAWHTMKSSREYLTALLHEKMREHACLQWAVYSGGGKLLEKFFAAPEVTLTPSFAEFVEQTAGKVK